MNNRRGSWANIIQTNLVLQAFLQLVLLQRSVSGFDYPVFNSYGSAHVVAKISDTPDIDVIPKVDIFSLASQTPCLDTDDRTMVLSNKYISVGCPCDKIWSPLSEGNKDDIEESD